MFAPMPGRTLRRVQRPLAVAALGFVFGLGYAVSPVDAGPLGTVELAMSVVPNQATASTNALTWTITVTPVDLPVAASVTVLFSTPAGPGPVSCSPACVSQTSSSAAWVVPALAGPVTLVATTGYAGSGGVTSSVTVDGAGVSCSNCPATAAVLAPAPSPSPTPTPAPTPSPFPTPVPPVPAPTEPLPNPLPSVATESPSPRPAAPGESSASASPEGAVAGGFFAPPGQADPGGGTPPFLVVIMVALLVGIGGYLVYVDPPSTSRTGDTEPGGPPG